MQGLRLSVIVGIAPNGSPPPPPWKYFPLKVFCFVFDVWTLALLLFVRALECWFLFDFFFVLFFVGGWSVGFPFSFFLTLSVLFSFYCLSYLSLFPSVYPLSSLSFLSLMESRVVCSDPTQKRKKKRKRM